MTGIQYHLKLPTEKDTMAVGKLFKNHKTPPLVLTFKGALGTGKTTLIRAILESWGVDPPIKSPTFTLVESYQLPRCQIHHFDLYRIQHESELDYLGFQDYFTQDAICCIEWPEQAPHYLKDVDVTFILEMMPSGRQLQICGNSLEGVELLKEVL